MSRTAVVIGAGPAGLTAALEMLRRTDIQPILLEASDEIGGISRTIRYKGNRMDIGGHRFFSKSDRVMQWWIDLMPPVSGGDEAPSSNGTGRGVGVQASNGTGPTPGSGGPVEISYQGQSRSLPVARRLADEPVLRGAGPIVLETDTDETGPADEPHPGEHGHTETLVAAPPADPDLVMLIRPRKSRIYYLRKFFDYPIKLTSSTLGNLGAMRTVRVGLSYFQSRVSQIAPEKSLEDFLINRFGRELYLTFFKSYTEKVWGTPCDQISAEWGAQRIKGLSLTTAVKHFVRKTFSRPAANGDLSQKDTDTSLIERFMYPKFGPGQLWEHVADQVVTRGGEIHMGLAGGQDPHRRQARRRRHGRERLRRDAAVRGRLLLFDHADARAGQRARQPRACECPGGLGWPAVPRLHHGRAAGRSAQGAGDRRLAAQRHLDLRAGARCAAGAPADLQ